jgi:hypothetical protein
MKFVSWAISAAIIAFVLFIGVTASFIYHIVREAFHIFPYHTMFAIVIFWIWLGFKLIPTLRDDL